jgi:mannose-6-phosphate isomerase-like protein (cupin superfamily)
MITGYAAQRLVLRRHEHLPTHHRERGRGADHLRSAHPRLRRRPPRGREPRQARQRTPEEALTIQQGRLGYQRPGEPPQFAGPGETVVFEPGEAHRFWNAGEEDLLCTGYVQPADNVEYFLTAIYESQRESGGSRPDPFESAFLMRRYRSEFYMAEIPAVVQRFVFPVQVAVGRLLGKYGKYADAPEPIRR